MRERSLRNFEKCTDKMKQQSHSLRAKGKKKISLGGEKLSFNLLVTKLREPGSHRDTLCRRSGCYRVFAEAGQREILQGSQSLMVTLPGKDAIIQLLKKSL